MSNNQRPMSKDLRLAALDIGHSAIDMTEITQRLSSALANRYRIERHLGEGGMATVYLAEDLKAMGLG